MLLLKLLVLAHLIADFPLQSDAVYRKKVSGAPGQVLHALIYAAAAGAVCYPMLVHFHFWLFLGWLGVTHIAIDALKVSVLERRAGLSNLWTFLLDQALHLSAVAAVLLTPLPGMAAGEGPGGALERRGWLDALIFFCAGVFGGGYLLAEVKRTLLGFRPEDIQRGGFAKYYGILERAAVFAIVVRGGAWLLALPVVLAFRLPMANRRQKMFRPEPFLMSRADAAGNFVVAAAAAIAAILCSR